MNIRIAYAIPMTVFSLFTAFYAIMSLAFFAGENRTEWGFPFFITVLAILTVWATVLLWRKQHALRLTFVSVLGVFGVTAWIITPPFSTDIAFLGIVLVALVSLCMLLGFASPTVRAALK